LGEAAELEAGRLGVVAGDGEQRLEIDLANVEKANLVPEI